MRARAPFQPHKLDVQAFIESGETLLGQADLKTWARMAESLAEGVTPDQVAPLQWTAVGRTVPRRVANSTVRSLTSRSGISVIVVASRSALRIDDIAQAIAKEVETEHRDHQRKADRKSTRLNSSHSQQSRMPSSA